MKLPKSFYNRPALEVAVELLGKVLVRKLDGKRLSGKIVETEAYVGPEDLACHASKGHTPRTSIMFNAGGCAYVYMIYGVYFCLNAVTGPKGFPSAVLIRALEPLENVEIMRRLRGAARDVDISSGPGKLCRAMSIDKALNGADLRSSVLWIEDSGLEVGSVGTSPRVGVDYAGEYRDKPWRFFVEGSPHVSKVRFRPPG